MVTKLTVLVVASLAITAGCKGGGAGQLPEVEAGPVSLADAAADLRASDASPPDVSATAPDLAADSSASPVSDGPSADRPPAMDAVAPEASQDDALDAPPPIGSCPAFGAPALIKTLTPKLFSGGADPSADPECSEVLNPERGFFAFRNLRALDPIDDLRGRGFTLIYGEALIPEYRAKDLDKPLLDQLSAAFAAVRAAGLKVLPRIYYADGMMADAPLDRVLAHIQQLTPLLRANADVIAVLHPGFVGAWGEWHSSTNNLTAPAARKQIYDALLAALPADRMTLTRRPSFKKEAYGGPLTAATAFTGKPLARVGHLNDCFLASTSDEGTYQLPGEEDFAVADSAFVPVGGETCGVFPPRSLCPSTLVEMARLHWSFINLDYHPEVIAGWKNGGCFSTIQCRLGFRLLALGHQSPAVVKKGSTLTVSLRVVNDGFGRVYNPRPVHLVLVGPQRQVFLTDADPRRWGPGETVDLCLSAKLPATLPSGSYQLGLWMPDAAESLKKNPAYAVRLSNLTWDASAGTNMLDAAVVVE
jgi:hypothetical protein